MAYRAPFYYCLPSLITPTTAIAVGELLTKDLLLAVNHDSGSNLHPSDEVDIIIPVSIEWEDTL